MHSTNYENINKKWRYIDDRKYDYWNYKYKFNTYNNLKGRRKRKEVDRYSYRVGCNLYSIVVIISDNNDGLRGGERGRRRKKINK